MLAVAEMYIKGVSTRDAEAVMREFGLESLSSSQVSRAAKLLDGELDAWRTVPSAFSTMLVQASERRSSCGRPRRMTVRISSSPSRRHCHVNSVASARPVL